MIGVDVEGHRLFKDGRTRSDYAAGYVAQRPNARFVVADYCAMRQPADLITAWFPFLTATAILAWRLPLELLQPRLAHEWCVAAGLAELWQAAGGSILSRERVLPPILSCWSLPE